MSNRTVSPQKWAFDDVELSGVSWAGIGTCVTVPQMQLSFDVAQGLPFAFGIKHFCITHGHQDHAGGVPYLISQKALMGHEPAIFYMPPPLVEPLNQIMGLWQGIEGHQYDYRFVSAECGQTYEIKPNIWMKPFPTVHRVPSQGYAIFKRKKQLRPDLLGLPGEKLRDLQESGQNIHTFEEKCLLAFTGDTQIEFLDQTPWLSEAEVLVMEVTYIDDKRSVQKAREWGHIHLEELIPRIPFLKCKKILLIHLSARHTNEEFRKILDRRLQPEDRERVEIFPRS